MKSKLAVAFVSMGLVVSATTYGATPAQAAPYLCAFSTTSQSELNSPQLSDTTVGLYCGGLSVPSRIVLNSTTINLSAFTVKTTKGYREARGQAYYIEKDTAGHGGTVWKLYSPSGKRLASLMASGLVARID